MTSRLIPVVFGIVCCCGPGAQAQIVVTPFVSANLRTAPGFIDLDDAARDLHGGFGVAVSMVTDGWLGAEGWVARPYVSLGAGVARIESVDVAELFVIDSSQPVATASVGAWVWFGQRVGIRTSIRFLRSVRRVEAEPFATWQPSIGVSWRF